MRAEELLIDRSARICRKLRLGLAFRGQEFVAVHSCKETRRYKAKASDSACRKQGLWEPLFGRSAQIHRLPAHPSSPLGQLHVRNGAVDLPLQEVRRKKCECLPKTGGTNS